VIKFVEVYESNDAFRRKLEDYERAMKTPQWEFLRDSILVLRGNMANELLSLRFAKLDPNEKDVQQRVYYHFNQLLEFLEHPTEHIKNKRRFKQPSQGAS